VHLIGSVKVILAAYAADNGIYCCLAHNLTTAAINLGVFAADSTWFDQHECCRDQEKLSASSISHVI
jgi:hypothetical protein